MRPVSFTIAVALLTTIMYAPVADAEKVKQWIAPPECVIDAGLPTQYILSEQDCYDLLHPPTTNPNGGGTNGSNGGTGTRSPSKAYLPIVFLTQINSSASTPLVEGKREIIIDRSANRYNGTLGVIILAVIYALLGFYVITRKLRNRSSDDDIEA